MAFYEMTMATDNIEPVLVWLGEKLVENGWVSMGDQTDTTQITGTVTSANSATLTDTSKDWVVNEHVGKLAWITSGPNMTLNRRTITSNTATQITVSASWSNGAPANGSSYAIQFARSLVFKSPSAVSGLPNDFYVTGYVGATATTLSLSLHEMFDPVTKARDKFAPCHTSSSPSTLAINGDYTAVTPSVINPPSTSWGNQFIGSTGTRFILTVGPSHFVIAKATALPSTNGGVLYLGAYDSFLPSALDPMPLAHMTFYDSSSTYYCMFTRDPGAVAGSSNNFRIGGAYTFNSGTSVNNFNRYAALQGLVLPSGFVGSNPFTGVNPAVGAQRILVRSVRNHYFPRGVFKDVLITASGVTTGQTMNVNFGGGVIKRYILVSTPGGSTGDSLNCWVPDEA